MKKNLLIILVCLFCFSCGVKDDPEYKSQSHYNNAIHLV
jgi:hypothetical protein